MLAKGEKVVDLAKKYLVSPLDGAKQKNAEYNNKKYCYRNTNRCGIACEGLKDVCELHIVLFCCE